MNRAVVLFSGGQDSTTCLWWARSRYDAVRAVSIDYGQRHRSELAAAERIAALAGVPHEVLRVPALKQLGGNALVDGSQAVEATGGLNGLPSTFVPMRNVLFLTLAAARAVQWGASDVVCGACETDYSGYPDCRRSTLDAVEGALSLAVDGRVRVVTPLMALTKADTVRLARTLPGCWEALALSVTCYLGKRPGCGGCPACVLRSRGFVEAYEVDPATGAQGGYRARAALGCPRCGASRVDGFVHCEKCRGYYAGRAARARSQYGKRRT
jgi:7-cyano-7-deazaguanine synthase